MWLLTSFGRVLVLMADTTFLKKICIELDQDQQAVSDSIKGFYACIYIEESGDLVGCCRCLADRQTTEYSATQLV